MLKESLANALYDPAMNLALEQERVDGAAEIVDDRIALDRDDAGVGIDLDLGDVAAVGIRLGGGRSRRGRIEARLHSGRNTFRIARRRRDLEQAEAAVGAGDAEGAVGELDVARRCLQQIGGDPASLRD